MRSWRSGVGVWSAFVLAAVMVCGVCGPAWGWQVEGDPFCRVRRLGSLDVPLAFQIRVVGPTAFARSSGGAGLHVIDVADPANPFLVTTVEGVVPQSLEVVGTTLYVADFSGRLVIFDVADRANPVERSSVTIGGAQHLAIVGAMVYVGSGISSTLTIVDASDPDEPRVRSSLRVGTDLQRMIERWPILYVSNGDHLISIDVTDPDAPRELDRYGDRIWLQTFIGSLALMRDIEDGEWLHRLVHTERPEALRLFRTGTFSYSMYFGAPQVIGDLMFTPARNGFDELAIHDVRDPASPRLLTHIDLASNANDGFYAVGNRLYAVSGGGLEIFDVGGCPPYAFCSADLDADGSLTVFDFLAFQNAFTALDPIADFDLSGELSLFDFLAFQNDFDAGCPGG